MATVVDFSFGHGSITPDALRKVDGCIGGIGYAGCQDTSKNITKAQLHALLDAGFAVGLVIENNITDLRGYAHGRALGAAILDAARALGFDYERCRLWTPYDTNAGSRDYAEIDDGMHGFASVVPRPGYYGDSDSIDYLHERHPTWGFWQSDSRSFSPLNPTPNAHLLQLFNDPRAHGLPVDVNNVLRTPIGLMGEKEDELSAKEVDEIKSAIADLGTAISALGDKVDADVQKVLNEFRADNGHLYRLQTFLEHVPGFRSFSPKTARTK